MIIESTAEERKILIEALDHQVDSYSSPYINDQQLKPIRNERKQIIHQIELFEDFTPVMREFIKNGLVKMRKYEDIDISDKSYLELFLDLDKYQPLAERNDAFSLLYNKFKRQKDSAKEIYQPLIEKLIDLKTNHRIFLSESDDDGKIYKFCLAGAKFHGFAYKSERLTLDLNYEKQSPSSYERQAQLADVMKSIEGKVENGSVTEFELQVMRIMKCLL